MLQFLAPTPRRKMTKARAARIFLLRNGVCFNCRQQIRTGQRWFIEHPDSIAQGGSDDDADLWPSHTDCKPEKDAADAKSKAKRDRLVTASYQPETPPRRMQGRGFNKRPKPHTATRETKKWTALS